MFDFKKISAGHVLVAIIMVVLAFLLFGVPAHAQVVADSSGVTLPSPTGETLSDIGIATTLSVLMTALLVRWVSWFNALGNTGRGIVFVACCFTVASVERALHFQPSASLLAAIPGALGLLLSTAAAAVGGTALFHGVKSQIRSS